MVPDDDAIPAWLSHPPLLPNWCTVLMRGTIGAQRLLQWGYESSTIRGRGIARGVKVSSHQKYTSDATCCAFTSRICTRMQWEQLFEFAFYHECYCFLSLHLLSLHTSVLSSLNISPSFCSFSLFSSEMRQWLTRTLQSICHFSPFPLLFAFSLDPSWMRQNFYKWKQDMEIFKRELNCLKRASSKRERL